MKDYQITRTIGSGKSQKVKVFDDTITAKNGHDALRQFGCNAPKGKSVYKNKKNRTFRAKPVKA